MVLTLFALFFRLYNIGSWLPLFVDESTLSLRAANIWSNHQTFVFSTWQNDGLVTVYSLIYTIFGSCDAVYLRLFQALSSVLSILLSFFIFKKMYGSTVAFSAAFLLALMPYNIFFSRLALMYSFDLLIFLLIV